jgi:hypothetical protein
MFPSELRPVIKSTASIVAVAGMVFFGSLLPQQAKAQYLPAYTTSNSLGGYTPTNIPSSFGFFFDVDGGANINALGFADQVAWTNGTQYTVNLWSFDGGGDEFSDYTIIANATFTAGDPYTLQYNYYWQNIVGSPLFLPDTFATDPQNLRGYVIAAIGDFSDALGNVQFETGDASFDPRIVMGGNGFNEEGFAFYPVPIRDGLIGNAGYFNANISFAPAPPPSPVPGPLPLLGAAAGFSWTRRLRMRLRASK